MSLLPPAAVRGPLAGYLVAAAVLSTMSVRAAGTVSSGLPFAALTLLSAAAVAFGSRRSRQRPAWPGWCLAGYLLLTGAGDLLFVAYAAAGQDPFPSLADACYLAAYPLLLLAVLGFEGRPQLSRPVLVDGAAVGVATALPLWVLVAGPAVGDGHLLARVVGLGYPLFDLVVLAVAAGALLGRRRGPGGWLLAAAVTALVLSDVAFAALENGYGGSWLDSGWLLERILLSVLALGSWQIRTAPPQAAVDRPRLLLLNGLALTAPASLLLAGDPSRTDVIVVSTGAALLTLLVLLRLSWLSGELRGALLAEEGNVRAAQAVADAGTRLLVGLNRGQVHRAALSAVLELLDGHVVRAAAALAVGPAQLLELVAADGRGLTPKQVAEVDLRSLLDEDLQVLDVGGELWRPAGPHDRLLVLPLRAASRTVGALLVAAPERALTDIAPRLRALAPQLAMALEAARLRAAAERRRESRPPVGVSAVSRPAAGPDAAPASTASDLVRALREGEFAVHYQPIVDLVDGRPKGFEALVRWQHPERGLLLPGQFLPQVEECGLLGQLDASVMLQACRQAVAWDPSPRGAYVSVNVSAEQLVDSRLVSRVRSMLAATGLAPWRLLVELTETAAVEDPSAVADVLRRLREMRVRVAFDDFGTGYSSLSWLQQLPLDVIKIDKTFVDRLPQPATERPVVEAVVRMAQTMGLDVVAEGVEREDQRAALLGMGVTSAQGWLFSRALPAEQAGLLLPGRRRYVGTLPVPRAETGVPATSLPG